MEAKVYRNIAKLYLLDADVDDPDLFYKLERAEHYQMLSRMAEQEQK